MTNEGEFGCSTLHPYFKTRLVLCPPLHKGGGVFDAGGDFKNSTNKAIHSNNISRAGFILFSLALATP